MNKIKRNSLFIGNINDVVENLNTLSKYLNSNLVEEKSFGKALMEKGKNYIVFKTEDNSFLFGPSKFIGYKSNTMEHHEMLRGERDGRETTAEINKIFLKKCEESSDYEKLLKDSFPDFNFNKSRKQFWVIF